MLQKYRHRSLLADINFTDKIWSCLPRMPSWGRGGSPIPREEMSCSYLPSKKSREELVTDYPRNYPNVTDDLNPNSASDSPSVLERDFDTYDESDDLVDAVELRRRTVRNPSVSGSQFGYPPSPSRR